MNDLLNPLDLLTADRKLPKGFDAWGIKSTRPDLTTKNGYQWPFPGKIATAANMLDHDDSCPRQDGDGICVATTWQGMASGGFPARTLLLIAYRSSEARGNEVGKHRVPEAKVVALIDGEAFVRANGKNANLYGANLYGANLYGANLYGANLYGANLYGANLRRADLRRADLRRADLRGADLRGANLYGADLRGADLRGADLRGADLRGADLSGAIGYAAVK